MTNDSPGGYNCQILRVNLTNGSISKEAITGLFCRKYLGGAGFVIYLLWKELCPGIDPLSPDNKIVFALGPLTGGPLPGGGRNCVGAKSPLTGGIAKSEVGGFWGAELKRAGFDAVIIEGKSPKPAYVCVHDGEARIKDASHLWGKDTKETQMYIKTELEDDKIRVASIGPGGESVVKYACIMNGLYDAVGRGGLGAVMGSKKLKAVVVRGHRTPKIVTPERVKTLREWLNTNMHLVQNFRDFGTGAAMEMYETIGNLPVRNFRDGLFPNVKNISAPTLKNTILTKMDACFGCPIRCKKMVQVLKPYAVDPAYGGPEYETLAALGSNCGIDNLKTIAKGNELCNAYSLDTISTGSVIAFAMECFEKGLLSCQDTGGIELRFGNDEVIPKLIELIARREGIGDLLAEGVAQMSKKIGRGSEEFGIQVKGLEAGMHEPRLKPGLGLGFMVNPHGADHVCNLHDTLYVGGRPLEELESLGILQAVPADDIGPRKIELFRLVQLVKIVFDSLVICDFFPYSPEQVADATAAITGWNTGVLEQLRVAERILTMARLFNIREGFGAADDRLPQRFFQSTSDGALAEKFLDQAKMERAKSYYYTLMGWDPSTGIPTPEKLEELDIA
jgi:aldehyde:ferredoxin oxidoreductase